MIFTKIGLFGNIYYDFVNVVNEMRDYTAIGGIGNLYHTFVNILGYKPDQIYIDSCIGNDKYTDEIYDFFQGHKNLVYVSDKPNIVSHIKVHTDLNHKSGEVTNKLSEYFQFINDKIRCQWAHLCYLDDLPKFNRHSLAQFRNCANIISVDFCKSNHDLDYLAYIVRYVDYIFMSGETFPGDKVAEYLLRQNKALRIITHTPEGSTLYDKRGIFENNQSKLYNINPLGAGDIFTSCFIHHMLNTDNIDISIRNSHIRTGHILYAKQNEQS